MQIPYRKPGKYALVKPDLLITQAKFDELSKKLEGLKKARGPMAEEVARLADLGDFSENVAYQFAKGKLRGINSGILEIERQLDHAEIITTQKQNDTVKVGHTVDVEIEGARKTYQILGSSESNPSKNVISHSSPLGAALLGRSVGDTVAVKLAKKDVEYQIIAIY